LYSQKLPTLLYYFFIFFPTPGPQQSSWLTLDHLQI
jgi:hypothetical protein